MATVAGVKIEPPKDKQRLSLFNAGIKTLTSAVKKAKQAGVADNFITRTIRNLSPKKAEKALMNKIADVKTTKKGREYVQDRPGGAGRFVTKKEGAKERAKARVAVYGGVPVAGASAVELSRAGKQKKDSKRTQAQFKKDYENRLTPDQVRKALNKGKNKSKIISTASADSDKPKKKKSGSITVTATQTGKPKRIKGKFMPRVRPFGGALAKVLLGKDEQFGGEGGLIDPDLGLGIRRKGKKTKTKVELTSPDGKKKVIKKNMGGMMKAKGKANGGMMKAKGRANGGAMKKKKGYAMGGSANLKKPGPNQKGLKKLPTAVRNNMGYMKDGGMPKKKGYAKGGPVRRMSKGGTARRGSPRGVGAAKRGFGKALRRK